MKYPLLITAMLLAVATAKANVEDLPAPKVTVLKFHADWCGSCKAMGPVMTDLENKFDRRDVLFVTFDRTNATTSHRSALLASALELDEVYGAHEGTGFILVVNHTGQVLAKLTRNDNFKAMAKAIQEHLG